MKLARISTPILAAVVVLCAAFSTDAAVGSDLPSTFDSIAEDGVDRLEGARSQTNTGAIRLDEVRPPAERIEERRTYGGESFSLPHDRAAVYRCGLYALAGSTGIRSAAPAIPLFYLHEALLI